MCGTANILRGRTDKTVKKLDRRTACKTLATTLGILSAGLGFWSSQIEVPQIGETLASGYVIGSVEIFAALKRQGDLGAWSAIAAAGAAVAAAFS